MSAPRAFGACVVVQLALSAGLVVARIEHRAPWCPIGDCPAVIESRYGEVLGSPVAIWSLLGAVAVFAAFGLGGDIGALAASAIGAVGAAVAAWFVVVQATVIGAWCVWCVASAVVWWATCALAVVWLVRAVRSGRERPGDDAEDAEQDGARPARDGHLTPEAPGSPAQGA